jgi:WD40 repeat protein
MILDMDFHPDGSKLIVAARDWSVTLWDIASGKRLQKTIINGDPRKLDWSPDGNVISISNYDGTRGTYRFEDNQFSLQDERRNASLVVGRFTPNGQRFISTAYGQSIEVHDARSGALEYSIPAHNGHTASIAFDKSGRRMVTGGSDNRIQVWDLAVDQQQPTRSITWGAVVDAIAIHPTNGEMAWAIQKEPKNKHRIEIRDVTSHRLLRELSGHTNWATCVAYSSDGKQLISGSLDNTVRVWNPETGEQTALLEGHEAPIAGVSFSNDLQNALSADRSGKVIVWDLANKSMERTWQLSAPIESVSFHPKRPWIAFACKGIGISIWDSLEGKELSRGLESSDCKTVCFSPNGQRLAIVTEDPITRVLTTEAVLKNDWARRSVDLVGHSDTIESVSFSPDGKRLVSCSRDESIRLFDVEFGYELLKLDSDKGLDGVVCFSGDGRKIVRTLPGNFSTWSIGALPTEAVRAGIADDETDTDAIAWHKAQASLATKNQNFFTAQFHQNYLAQYYPEDSKNLWERARSNMFLGNHSDAQVDLLAFETKADPTQQKRLLEDLVRVYLFQEKRSEALAICERLSLSLSNSKNPADLNVLLWLTALGDYATKNTQTAKRRFEGLVTAPKNHKASYLTTLALSHYREGAYRKAFDLAKESNKLLKGTASPSNWMIMALACAKIDQQWIGWIPYPIRSKVHELGLSGLWNSSLKCISFVDKWMEEHTEMQRVGKTISNESLMLLKVDLPILKKEWSSIEKSNSPW